MIPRSSREQIGGDPVRHAAREHEVLGRSLTGGKLLRFKLATHIVKLLEPNSRDVRRNPHAREAVHRQIRINRWQGLPFR